MGTFIAIVIAYLIGSINMSIIISKILKKPDPRTQGSGNAGATNMLRTGSKQQAALVLIGDLVKGLLAVFIGHALGAHGLGIGFVALAAVLGHVFPLYFQFRGGKGVATMIGVLIAMNLYLGVIAIIAWIITAFVSRYASLASLVAAIVAVALTLILGRFGLFIPVLLIAALIFWKHIGNIERLKNKTESKINF